MVTVRLDSRDIVNLTDAAKRLGVSRPTIYRWIKSGDIISLRFGDVQVIPVSEIKRLLKENEERNGRRRRRE